MSIDATILAVDRDGGDLVLTLGPRIDNDDKLSIEGQSKMRIIAASWDPPVGADIWGGGSSVEIVPGHWYTRDGYTRLIERAPAAPTGEAKP